MGYICGKEVKGINKRTLRKLKRRSREEVNFFLLC